MRLRRWNIGAVVVAAAAAIALALPTVAAAFDVSKSTNGVIINKESTDTSAGVSVTVYYDYRGGESWTATFVPVYTGSYNRSRAYGLLWPTGEGREGIEIPLESGYKLQAVMLSQSGVGQQWFCLINEPLRVSEQGTVTVKVAEQPPVTLESSVSVDGTLPVKLTHIGQTEADGVMAGTWLALGVAMFMGGYGVSRVERRRY